MRALVIGAAGQDGSFLCEQLEAEGAQVFSLTRQGMNGPVALDRTPIMLSDRAAMMSVVKQFAFDQYTTLQPTTIRPRTDWSSR